MGVFNGIGMGKILPLLCRFSLNKLKIKSHIIIGKTAMDLLADKVIVVSLKLVNN